MNGSRDLLLQMVCQQAGISEEQLDAARRGDVSSVLAEAWSRAASANGNDADLRERLRLTSQRLEASQAQLAAAVGLLQQLAGMFGCCSRCWGTNGQCPFCGGRGTPGYRRPDPGLMAWVEPALQRLELAPSARSRSSDNHTAQGEAHD
jgi:hypothetical protein